MRDRPIIIAEAWPNSYYELCSTMISLNYVLWLSYDTSTHLFLPKEQIINQEVLQVKKHLSYRLGNALVKNPLTFVFKIKRIYKKWKKGRK